MIFPVPLTIPTSPSIRHQSTLFFKSNSFVSNARLKLAKNQVKAKRQPEAELFVFENYSFSSSTLSYENSKKHSKKCTKTQRRLF